MKLIPYHHTFAELIMDWQNDSANVRYFREFDHMLTMYELEELPKLLGEVFMVSENRNIIGMVNCKQVATGAFGFGVLIAPELQNKGRSIWIVKLIEDYLFNVKNARKIMFDVSKEHGLTRFIEEELGYKFAGRFEKHRLVNGQWEDSLIYEKMRCLCV